MVQISVNNVDIGPNRQLLCALFEHALAAADPMRCVRDHLPSIPERGRIVVVGAGKASAAMARSVEVTAKAGGWFDRLEGIVVTRYAHGVDCGRIKIVEASHPVPDAAGEAAATRILALVRELNERDLLLCLVSGGGSALLALAGRRCERGRKS